MVRYPRDTLPELAEKINAAGYGLTFGIHTRIDENYRTAYNRVKRGIFMLTATLSVRWWSVFSRSAVKGFPAPVRRQAPGFISTVCWRNSLMIRWSAFWRNRDDLNPPDVLCGHSYWRRRLMLSQLAGSAAPLRCADSGYPLWRVITGRYLPSAARPDGGTTVIICCRAETILGLNDSEQDAAATGCHWAGCRQL